MLHFDPRQLQVLSCSYTQFLVVTGADASYRYLIQLHVQDTAGFYINMLGLNRWPTDGRLYSPPHCTASANHYRCPTLRQCARRDTSAMM
jgi:hypothetical protein